MTGVCRSPVHDRVADHQGLRRVHASLNHERAEASGVRLSRKGPVSANDPLRKVPGQTKSLENRSRGRKWLVGEDCERHPAIERIQKLDDAGIGSRESQHAAVVDGKEASQGVWRLRGAGCGKRASDERRCAVTHHASDRVLGLRRRAAVAKHLVRRLREVPPRIDQRAVEIEDDEVDRYGRSIPDVNPYSA